MPGIFYRKRLEPLSPSRVLKGNYSRMICPNLSNVFNIGIAVMSTIVIHLIVIRGFLPVCKISNNHFLTVQ